MRRGEVDLQERVRFRVLGPFEVEVDGRPLDAGPPKQRALLAILAVHAGRVVSVDTIIEELWGGEAPPKALGSLQAYVSNLRRLIEPARQARSQSSVLVTRPPGWLVLITRPRGLNQVFVVRALLDTLPLLGSTSNICVW